MIIVMESMRDTICKNFNRILSERPDIKVKQLADAMDVHTSMIYKYKSGENVPDVEKLDMAAKFFRVDVMEFYSSGSSIVSLHPSRALKKYLVIPDEIVNLAFELSDDHDSVWKDIAETLEIAIEDKKLQRKS